MDDLWRLSAIENIKKLKARYFRCMDTKDWEGMRRVFSHDAQFDMSAAWSVKNAVTSEWQPPIDPSFRIAGRDDFIALLERSIGHLHTVHHGHMPEIDILSETEATGIWSMEDVIRNADGQPQHSLQAFGHYHESYRRLDGGWVISAMQLTRLYIRENVAS